VISNLLAHGFVGCVAFALASCLVSQKVQRRLKRGKIKDVSTGMTCAQGAIEANVKVPCAPQFRREFQRLTVTTCLGERHVNGCVRQLEVVEQATLLPKLQIR